MRQTHDPKCAKRMTQNAPNASTYCHSPPAPVESDSTRHPPFTSYLSPPPASTYCHSPSELKESGSTHQSLKLYGGYIAAPKSKAGISLFGTGNSPVHFAKRTGNFPVRLLSPRGSPVAFDVVEFNSVAHLTSRILVMW